MDVLFEPELFFSSITLAPNKESGLVFSFRGGVPSGRERTIQTTVYRHNRNLVALIYHLNGGEGDHLQRGGTTVLKKEAQYPTGKLGERWVI